MPTLPGLTGTFSTILIDPPRRFDNRTAKPAPEHRRLPRCVLRALIATMDMETHIASPWPASQEDTSMGYLLCDNVGPGLRESEAGVTVHDITGRPQRLRVERDFLREANQRYYLPIGVVARDPAAPRVLIEFPHEADSGANRIWVAPDQLLGEQGQPQKDAAAPDPILGLMADEPELFENDRHDDRADKHEEPRPEQPHKAGQLPAIWGLMADEPELVDQVVADIYKTRETQPLRQPTSE